MEMMFHFSGSAARSGAAEQRRHNPASAKSTHRDKNMAWTLSVGSEEPSRSRLTLKRTSSFFSIFANILGFKANDGHRAQGLATVSGIELQDGAAHVVRQDLRQRFILHGGVRL